MADLDLYTGQIERYGMMSVADVYARIDADAARIAALEAEIERATALLVIEKAHYEHEYKRAEKAEAALATARADALGEAARVAEAQHDRGVTVMSDQVYLDRANVMARKIAAAIRALALTQPASTQPLTDQGETSTAGEALK